MSRRPGTAHPAGTGRGNAVSLTWAQAAALRVRRHRLEERAPHAAMLGVVSEVGGLHAQVMSSAELTLWARVEGLEDGELGRALWQDRRLVKTWAVRGTLHVVPADEYWMWQAALSAYEHYLKPGWLRAFGVTRDDLELLLDAVAEALDGRMLSREELATEVGRRTGSTELGDKLRESWGALLKPAAYRGHLCFAPSVGQNVRFTRPDWWLGAGRRWEPSEARAELTRRFLASNGPTRPETVARWWGGTSPPQAARLIRALGDEVREVEVEGTRHWMLAADVEEAVRTSPATSVRLLPAFDQYVVTAARDDLEVIDVNERGRVYRPQGWLSPVVVAGGRMVAVWRQQRRRARLEVVVEPFAPLPPHTWPAVEEEAQRLAAFVGADLELSRPA